MSEARMGPDTERAWSGRFLFGVLGLALLLRALLILNMGNRYYFGDTGEYDRMARSILAGLGPGSEIPRAPLYPMIMAAGYRLGGIGDYQAVRWLQLIFGLGVVLQCGRLARRIGGPLAGRLGLLAAAVAPTLVFTTGLLYPTSLYTLLLLSATLAAWDLAHRPRWIPAAGLGASLGLAWLTDQIVMGPALFLLAWAAWGAHRHGRRAIAALALALVVLVMVATPWLAYSRSHYGGTGVFFAKAQYVLHLRRHSPAMNQHRAIRDTSEFHPLGMQALARREWGYLRNRPAAFLSDYGKEYLHFFTPLPDRIQTSSAYTRPLVRSLDFIFYAPVLLLALLGLARGAAPVSGRILAALVPLGTAFTYAFFMTQTRYRIPTDPQMLVLAVLGLTLVLPGIARRLAGLPVAGAAPPRRGAPGRKGL